MAFKNFIGVLQSRWFWRLAGVTAVIELLALALIGISFFLIIHGSLMLFLRLAPHWQVANRAIIRISPEFAESPLARPQTVKWPSLLPVITRAITWVFLVAVGIWLLVDLGFCGQNLICAIASSGLR